jgi:two-component system response regulator (stage 0 sporulation protein F)
MKQKRILIVEDKLHNVMTLCRALLHPMAGGFQVEVCPMADVALTRLQREQFDLIVTDLRLPGASGLELIRRVHQTSPGTRTMLITAFGSPELEKQLRGLGATYLPKPFALQEFVAAIHRVFAEE